MIALLGLSSLAAAAVVAAAGPSSTTQAPKYEPSDPAAGHSNPNEDGAVGRKHAQQGGGDDGVHSGGAGGGLGRPLSHPAPRLSQPAPSTRALNLPASALPARKRRPRARCASSGAEPPIPAARDGLPPSSRYRGVSLHRPGGVGWVEWAGRVGGPDMVAGGLAR